MGFWKIIVDLYGVTDAHIKTSLFTRNCHFSSISCDDNAFPTYLESSSKDLHLTIQKHVMEESSSDLRHSLHSLKKHLLSQTLRENVERTRFKTLQFVLLSIFIW